MKHFLYAAVIAVLVVCGAVLSAVPQSINPVTIVPPWSRFSATGDLDNSTDVSIKAAATGKVYCVTSIQVSAKDTLGGDMVVRLLSNDTVLWQHVVPAEGDVGANAVISAYMPTGVCTVAGEALEIDVDGDPTDNLVFYNVQGFTVN